MLFQWSCLISIPKLTIQAFTVVQKYLHGMRIELSDCAVNAIV